jgi:hypothetical protein
MSQKLT